MMFGRKSKKLEKLNPELETGKYDDAGITSVDADLHLQDPRPYLERSVEGTVDQSNYGAGQLPGNGWPEPGQAPGASQAPEPDSEWGVEPSGAPAQSREIDEGILGSLTSVDSRLGDLEQRLSSMNAVLRQQSEAIEKNSEKNLYLMLKPPAGALAEVHSNLVQQIEMAAEAGQRVDDLDFIRDGVEEALGLMGIEILQVQAGDPFVDAIHRRIQVLDVNDAALSKTVQPAKEKRSSLAYRFRDALAETVVRKAQVVVLRHRAS